MNKYIVDNFEIIKFFRGCVWDFKDYPDEEIADYFSKKENTVIDLSDIQNTTLFTDIKDIFVCIFANNEPYTYKSKAFPSLVCLKDFMLQKEYRDFADISDADEADKEWQQYWSNKGKTYLHNLRYVISNCCFILKEYRDARKGLERNYWWQENMSINDERVNKSNSFTTMNFWRIKNEDNRELLKLWFKYLIGATELSYTTIYEKFSLCCQFVNDIGDVSLLEVTHQTIDDYLVRVKFSSDRNNQFLNTVEELFKYLTVKKQFAGEIPVIKQDYMPNVIKYIHNTVDESTILELFRHIHKLPDCYLLMFLINLFTGIRISDICQLEKNCLYHSKHGYFLRHKCQKMQDAGSIPISRELYDLIQKRIDYCAGQGYKYLFPAERDKTMPYNAGTYRRNMQKITSEWKIKNADGTPYHLLTHAFRHTIATTLSRMGMPSTMIQIGILHHKSIDMSRHYIESSPENELDEMEKRGINAKSADIIKITADDAPLANGYCGMPARIRCEKINACLNCKYFRTSIKFLDVHRQHLENVKEKIEYCRSNGFEQNLHFAETEKGQLELIINKLENMEGGSKNGTTGNET